MEHKNLTNQVKTLVPKVLIIIIIIVTLLVTAAVKNYYDQYDEEMRYQLTVYGMLEDMRVVDTPYWGNAEEIGTDYYFSRTRSQGEYYMLPNLSNVERLNLSGAYKNRAVTLRLEDLEEMIDLYNIVNDESLDLLAEDVLSLLYTKDEENYSQLGELHTFYRMHSTAFYGTTYRAGYKELYHIYLDYCLDRYLEEEGTKFHNANGWENLYARDRLLLAQWGIEYIDIDQVKEELHFVEEERSEFIDRLYAHVNLD